jgi:hypothetical protein
MMHTSKQRVASPFRESRRSIQDGEHAETLELACLHMMLIGSAATDGGKAQIWLPITFVQLCC